MPSATDPRVVLDVTSLVRWSGPPVGIIRVAHALAMPLRAQAPERLVVYDNSTGSFRQLAPAWMDTVLGQSGLMDRHIPQPFPRNLLSRAGLVMALERLRLTNRHAALADRLQRLILAPRPHQFPLEDKEGNRIANVPRDLALGPDYPFGPDDVLLLPGMSWSYLDPATPQRLKAATGCRVSTICYDLIPVTHPHFYSQADRDMLEGWWRGALPVIDHVIVTAEAIRRDLAAFCEGLRIAPPPTAIADLGYDPPPAQEAAPLPQGLRSRQFVLFVSTIEPRKGHAVLLDAWQRLLDQGVPQQHDFTLVFVGRPGWMVEDVLRRLDPPPARVLHLARCSDQELATLYRHAAFCCFPSQYEGYGLPLIEAFGYGRAVLCANGGASPETAGPFAPCLDPLDTGAWASAMDDWIRHPDHIAHHEHAIAAQFRHPRWPEAAATILDIAAQGATGDQRVRTASAGAAATAASPTSARAAPAAGPP
jgi:glycosyltransferase involved in cell wall biosynthesis